MLAIRAEVVFDGERKLSGGVTVLIDAGRIVAVGPGATEVPAGYAVLEFPGSTLLPGLIDVHVHLGADRRFGALDRLAGSAANARVTLPITLGWA